VPESSIVDKVITLRLNSNWVPIGKASVKDALIAMNSTNGENLAAVGLNIEYDKKDGEWDFSNPIVMEPVGWARWIKLPLREFDFAVHTSKLTIRVPTVIIATNYGKVPKKYFRPTPEGIRQRDQNTCQVTGKILPNNQLNIDHNLPKSRGGKDTWENMTLMDKELNSKKGDKTLEEMGWKLIRKPKAPAAIPVSALIKEARSFDWNHFLIKDK
jgi:5-methylcytosine-specific restriction endonuclease McrA